jgi:hypothetical protein
MEIFFHRLKRFRAVATRYEKTARNYLALVQLVVWRAAAERGIPGVSPQQPSAFFPYATFAGTRTMDSP